MKNLGTKSLETERLILRKFKLEDAKEMYNNWANSTEVTKFLRWEPHKNLQESKEYIEMVINNYNKDDYYEWAIEIKDTKEVIGSIGVVTLNKKIESAHIGYCLGEKFWHKRIMSEALERVIDFLFNDVSVNRIESFHDPKNENSGKVMLKCNMKYEGETRDSDFNNLGICNCRLYAILKREYLK